MLMFFLMAAEAAVETGSLEKEEDMLIRLEQELRMVHQKLILLLTM